MFEFHTYGLAPAVIVAVLSVARTLRLVIFDDFPPMEWVRERVLLRYTPEKWVKLWTCPFCLAPYAMAVMIGWAYLSDLHWTWWTINGIWGLSYLAATYVAYDQPED